MLGIIIVYYVYSYIVNFIKQRGETAKDLIYNWHHFSPKGEKIVSLLDAYSDIAVSIIKYVLYICTHKHYNNYYLIIS